MGVLGRRPAGRASGVEDMLSRRNEAGIALHVRPAPDVLAIFRPYEPEQIDFDVDLRELQGQRQLDLVCQFFTLIGRKLRKPVLMTPRGAGTIRCSAMTSPPTGSSCW